MRDKFGLLLLILALIFIIALCPSLNAATQKVLYTFTRGTDGGIPSSGVIFGPDGNLYGVTQYGGPYDAGTVFQLSYNQGNWIFTTLYSFTGGSDGHDPVGGLTFDEGGNLYGTTYGYGCGTVFKMTPNGSSWTFTTLHTFFYDGCNPEANLRFDKESGLLFGTTFAGGSFNQGTAFSIDTDGNNETVYSFSGNKGRAPAGGINSWHYGTTDLGGKFGFGNIFQWLDGNKAVVKHVFNPRSKVGGYPFGDLLTQINNGVRTMYGTTQERGIGGQGSVYQLKENPSKHDEWALHVLHSFSGADGGIPAYGLTPDATGNLYGITALNPGTVFKLAPVPGRNKWTHTILYQFTGGLDGRLPTGILAMDANGNLYGTTSEGGAYNTGVVYQIIP